MNQKALSFAELAVNTTKQLTSGYTEWTAFLGTVGRLYKYPYHEQVLIYAQRPEATACASFDVWNKRMNRAVRRGSRGIALMDTSEGTPRVQYVFDIADTVGRDKSRRPYLWQYRDEHADVIASTLADHFGVAADRDLPYQLEVIADDLAGEYWAEHYADILACVPGSFLEEYDEFNIEAAFRSAASASTTYAMLSRCGLNPDEYFSHEDFMNVFDFNTPDAATALGTAVSENSEQVLRQIEVVIKNFERTRRAERSNEHGEQSEIPAGGGLPAAGAGHRDTIDLGEVRTDEGAVSAGESPGVVQPPDSQRQAGGASVGDRPDSDPAIGAYDAPAERDDGPDGADEGQRPHEMGGADEQRQGEGRGDDSGGADLPVTPPAIDFTAVGPTGLQYSHREIGNKDLPYFEDVSEKRELIWKCDALKNRRSEVAEQFAAHTSVEDRCAYLKSLFNNTYIEMILDSGQRVGYRAYDDVLHLWRGSYPSREQEEYLSWEDTVSAIEGMVQDGVWVEQTAAPEKPTPKKSQSKQDFEYPMDLFGLAGSTIPLQNEPGTNPVPARPQLPQNIIDTALTLGANDPDSRLRIVAEFMKDKPLGENVRFLQSHYKENGAGFYVCERKYSLWYNEAGMQIASGESALTFTAAALTWEQAAERIRELLDEGLYADQSTLYLAWPFEQHRVAEALQYLHSDIDKKYKDKYLPTLTDALADTFGYPAVVEKTQELLGQPEHLKAVIDEFAAFMKDYAHNRDILRFHYHRPQEIMQGLEDLQRTPLKFAASPDYAPVERFFISQDEIDNLLREQPDHHDYRIGVYNFFDQHPDRKEREKYLSHLHGEYSGYHGGNDNITYTHKELTFTHGDIIEPYAAVKMKWSQVRKRIEELIKKDAFLSVEDREIMESRALGAETKDAAPPIEPEPLSEQDAKKHDILMANTKAHFAGYEEVKQAHPGDIILFQRGDFFEMYGPDARVASMELDIQLTNRNIPELGRVAMCGVPANDLDYYLEMLRREHDVTISAVPENGAERQTYYFSSYKDVPKVSLAPPSSDSSDQAREQIIIATSQMVPNIDEYTRIKGQFPGYVVGVQNGDTLYFYGTDAEKAGPALNRNVLIRDIPGMGAVSITGDVESWQASKEKLLRKGIDLTFVRLDEIGKYEIIITGTAAEYIPVGMELDIDGRRCRIESVDFQQDAVHLTVLDSGYSLTESVRYVREYVEEAYDKELEKAAEDEKSRLFVEHVMEDVEQLAEPEQAPIIRELHEQYKAVLLPKVMEDEAYRNACQNSDRQNAVNEGRNAVERAAKDLGITQGDMQFYQLYFGDTALHNRLKNELVEESYPILLEELSPAKATPVEEELTDLQQQAIEIARRYESLPLQDRLNSIAQTFGCTTAKIEVSPCSGKWRGTSDVSIRFDNGLSLFLGNEPAGKAKSNKVQSELVNNTLRRYNPEIVRITKETALEALRNRAVKDNEIAMQKGLKPYSILNVEMNESTHDSGYIGWYYVTLAVDGKIHAHLESGLNYEISDGKVGEGAARGNFFVAGGLHEEDVDFVFHNVGHSSTAGVYTLHISDAARERAERTLAEQEARAVPVYEELTEEAGSRQTEIPEHDVPQTIRYIVVSDDYSEAGHPFTIYDSWNQLHYAETGDLINNFDTREEAQAYADKLNGGIYTSKPVTVYPAEKNNLPYDVVIEKLHIEEPNQALAPQNFHITDDNLGAGGAKAKYQMNIDALKTLHEIESEERTATPEEQEILSKYVGWGALQDAFDPNKPSWASEYQELQEMLTPEEYDSARASVLNSHYTSPTVIRAIYQVLDNIGFKGGSILEPSMGVGNFFGLLPDSMSNSKLYGIELDGLTGRIAKQLYPNAHIEIKGYERTALKKDRYDVAVGNVPFGNYKVYDPAYDKLGFSIHNYFFARTIDQVRPWGIVAFVTSRYTMDSKSTDAREYIAERADLLGAIRLPNNAFLSNAGTEVVTDILFLQKREEPITELPDWVFTAENADGYAVNRYFIQHPEMVMGTETFESTRFGYDYTVKAAPGADLGALLEEAITHIEGSYVEAEAEELEEDTQEIAIPADPNVKNFSYTIVDGDVYYRQDSSMVKIELKATSKARVSALIDLRDCAQRLISKQMKLSITDEDIKPIQMELNRLYDNFTAKFGLINDKMNERAFSQDSSYYLLCALEILDDEGKFLRKADMFTKRTILPRQEITHVDTATEALAVSIGERARVDIPFMAGLTGMSEEEIVRDLQGQIYPVPFHGQGGKPIYQTADEYLSGNVRQKLSVAQVAAASDPTYEINVDALTAALPRDLDASEIQVRLGATWIDPEYVDQFMRELLKTPGYARDSVHVQYSLRVNVWNISNKGVIRDNDVAAYSTYGTHRASAYELLEDALNLQNTQIFDLKEDADGNDKRVLNVKETTLAQQKQSMIKLEFQNWLWRDPDRRQTLVRKYNDEMNCIRPRQYDGSNLVLEGMNPEIQLEEHQKNAIARAVYGGNTLFAHCVGAGKTFEITASAMEMKRLGLCSKSMIVVPNHLTQQWASEFLRLYPNANILVTTKRDFEKNRRKKFCSRIATGNYDAVIIGYSQFEKVPISKERQINLLYQQIDDIADGIKRAKAENGEKYTVKYLERTKRSLEDRLRKLQGDNRKDDVINFEELGIDRLFVDEADTYKNMFLYTKMRNVAGLSTSEAQKSTDLFNKTRYLDEITDYKGVIFATGTPISNSITEMYTMQRYLQYSTLQGMGIEYFDSWASRFGETTTTMELAPEGTGYRPRTRFAKFFNLPELMNIFHEVADIKTEDMLNLPTPDVEYHNEVAQPTEFQREYVQELSERATAVRNREVDVKVDNMLCITNDGRKLGLDQRLISPFAGDDPSSKLNQCIENILAFWQQGKDEKLTQLVFCDLSTPKKDGSFSVYNDIKSKLVAKGVPESEVAFIHDADTEARKKELFGKVRSGKVRVLIGSTQKLGAGTNVQDRLIALHHLDCPWRPRDLTQREGRIIRRGNMNPLVHVFRYVTEGSFDSYLWQTVEKKQQFIGQIMTSKSPVRSCEDVDEAALSYAEVKALCAGDPRIKERMELDVDVAKLQLMQASHRSQQYELEDKIRLFYPQEQQRLEWRIEGIQQDICTLAAHPLPAEGYLGIDLLGQHFDERKKAGVVLLNECNNAKAFTTSKVGEYRGLEVHVKKHNLLSEPQILLKGAVEYAFTASDSDIGNITKIDNALDRLPDELEKANVNLENTKQQFENAKLEVGKPFPQEQELQEKMARIAELDIELKMEDSPSGEPEPVAVSDDISL